MIGQDSFLKHRRIFIWLILFLTFITLGFWYYKSGGLNVVSGPERHRQFVGDNPSSCSQYIESVLISYSCFGPLAEADIHLPATSNLPSYTIKKSIVVNTGYIQGFAYSNGQHIVLLRHPPFGEENAYYSIAAVGGALSIKSSAVLEELDASKNYFIKSYKNGLLIYSADLSQAYYNNVPGPEVTAEKQVINYPNLSSGLEKLILDSPSDKSLGPVSFETSNGENYLRLYSSSNKKASEIIISSSGKNRQIQFKEPISKALACGSNKMCLLSEKRMKVYDIGSDKPKYLFGVNNAIDMIPTDKSFVVVNSKGVLKIDINNRNGIYEYTFGKNYRFAAIQAASQGYVLTLTNNKEKRVALYINEAEDDKDEIDKKIAELQKMPQIKTARPSGKHIYISPDLGDFRVINGEGGYDPKVKESVLAKINKEIDKLKIDRKDYEIHFTL